MGGWGFLLMTLTSVLWVVLVVAGVVLLVRSLARGPQPSGGGGAFPPPEQVLAARYARGEIDDEEYHRRLATLSQTAAVRRPGP